MAGRYDFDVAILGGGAAGLTVAAGGARLGARVLLVEAEERLGGDCLHFGCVPSKTLIATAAARIALRRAPALGLPAVDVPPVDFAAVNRRIAQVVATIQKHDSVARFEGLGATVRFGAARFVDDHTLEVAGRRCTAARFVLATGSRAAVPPIPGLSEAGFLTNRELFSLPALPASLLVLGGGPMAVEMAQAFCRLGSRVTLVQRSPCILTREDPDMAAIVADSLADEGVDLRLGARVTRVAVGPAGKTVFLERQGREERITAGEILCALGRRPRLDGLGLEAAGVAVEDGRLVLDARLRTTSRHMFAAGDVTGRHLFTHAAGYEGGLAVANAVLRLPRRADYRRLPRCTYADPALAVVGATETEARAAGGPVTVVTEPFAANDRAVAEGRSEGMVKLVLGRRGKLLGAQIVGVGAGELLAEWVAVMAGGGGLAGLAGAVHPYPTRAEASRRAAGRRLEAMLFSPLVRRALALLWGYRGRSGKDREVA